MLRIRSLRLALSSGQLSCSVLLLPNNREPLRFFLPSFSCKRPRGARPCVRPDCSVAIWFKETPWTVCSCPRGGKRRCVPSLCPRVRWMVPFCCCPTTLELPTSSFPPSVVRDPGAPAPVFSRVLYARCTLVVRNPMDDVLVKQSRTEVLRTTCSWRRPARCTWPSPG